MRYSHGQARTLVCRQRDLHALVIKAAASCYATPVEHCRQVLARQRIACMHACMQEPGIYCHRKQR